MEAHNYAMQFEQAQAQHAPVTFTATVHLVEVCCEALRSRGSPRLIMFRPERTRASTRLLLLLTPPLTRNKRACTLTSVVASLGPARVNNHSIRASLRTRATAQSL
jgi:hypothetical protein